MTGRRRRRKKGEIIRNAEVSVEIAAADDAGINDCADDSRNMRWCTCSNLLPLPSCDLPSCAEHYPLLQSLPSSLPLFQIKYALLQSQPQAIFLLSASISTQVRAMKTQGHLVSVTSLTAWLSRYLHPCFFSLRFSLSTEHNLSDK